MRALELIQARPGITADQLGAGLGVTGRAARRYVAILREADLPVESVSGPYGGYRVGRGLRLPPLMFTAAEATGLVMATIEGHRGAADPADVVGGALAKILRVLPERVAVPTPTSSGDTATHEHLERLLAACSARRVLRLSYRTGRRTSVMEVEPWAVVLRHSRWYLLCWSRSREAQRVLRVDRVESTEPLAETFEPPDDLDAMRTVEEHFSQGWRYAVEVVVEAPPEQVERWVPRSFARLEALPDGRTRMVATTDDPDWYARHLALIPVRFTVVGDEVRAALAGLAQRLDAAAGSATSGRESQRALST
ncbi:helix-turn-helix transcriptional regulator [Nocardioides conyzicola]|uniref:WYL domain-containing protein n=1 Tax=Nocardioides conyzicola TaxID=1651781 RepID=A0ABP8XJ73_9ACTN